MLLITTARLNRRHRPIHIQGVPNIHATNDRTPIQLLMTHTMLFPYLTTLLQLYV